MATFMTSIPRRKIYETMLEFEDCILDMQIMLYNEKNFNKFSDKFNTDSLPKLRNAYYSVKAIFIVFFENKKYEKTEDFEKEIKEMIKNNPRNTMTLRGNLNLPKTFKKILGVLDKSFLEIEKIKSLKEGKRFEKELDVFHDSVPKLLEIRRDKMRI